MKSAHFDMPIEEFLSIPPYRGQRDTGRHAKRMVGTLQAAPSETLTDIAVLVYPDGRREVADGNTRQELWRDGRLSKPMKVHAKLYYLSANDSEAEAKTIYVGYNNVASGKDAKDEVVSAMRRAGWEPRSAFCKAAKLKSALAYAEGNRLGLKGAVKGPLDYLDGWLPQLSVLDEMLATGKERRRTAVAVLAAVLLSLRRHGKPVIPFWKIWFSNGWEGTEVGDPINKLHGYITDRDRNNSSSTTIYGSLEIVIYIVERWLKGDPKIIQLRAVNLIDGSYGRYCVPDQDSPQRISFTTEEREAARAAMPRISP